MLSTIDKQTSSRSQHIPNNKMSTTRFNKQTNYHTYITVATNDVTGHGFM